MSQLYQNTKNRPALTVPVRSKPDLAETSSDASAEVQQSVEQETLWVAVSFPFLPLEALGETAQQQPMAVYAQQGQIHTIIVPNYPAQKSGIRSGMTLTAAPVSYTHLRAHET